jgi:protein TonB
LAVDVKFHPSDFECENLGSSLKDDEQELHALRHTTLAALMAMTTQIEPPPTEVPPSPADAMPARANPGHAMFTTYEQTREKRSPKSIAIAVGAHVLVILLIAYYIAKHTQLLQPAHPTLITEVTAPPPPLKLPPAAQKAGGGGGQHDLAPVSHGAPPKMSPLPQILPPKIRVDQPKLPVAPTIVGQVKMADSKMDMGMPTGTGPAVSMGNGHGSGIGSGTGDGAGPGSGGGAGGGVYHVGGGVSAPVIIRNVDPEFSEEARKAKFSGNVMVSLIIDENGNATHVRVVRGVGMGLDENAIAAVRQDKFRPAMKDGKPVKVQLNMEVNFQIF